MADPAATPIADIPKIVSDARAYFDSGVTHDVAWRKAQLAGLSKCLEERREEWVAALAQDLGRTAQQSRSLLDQTRAEVEFGIENLDRYLEPETRESPVYLQPGKILLIPEPYGVVLDIVPFNYPVSLSFQTLIPILQAGNVAVLRPSRHCPATAALLAQIVPKYVDPEGVRIVLGGPDVCNALLAERFDFIFYTGGAHVGRITMAAAARYLTPILLELGGKSPVYIDSKVDLPVVLKRLCLGKFMNAGQTCVAPDYVLVNATIWDRVTAALKSIVEELYGDPTEYNPTLTQIVSPALFARVSKIIETCGGEFLVKGVQIPEKKWIYPTIVLNPKLDSQLMKEEIFGPVLPLVTVASADEALSFIRAREKPLAAYVFSSDEAVQQKFIKGTSSGSLVVNDVTMHVKSFDTPFGGVGQSGFGRYRGRAGFQTLSNIKSVFWHDTSDRSELGHPSSG